MTLWSRVSLGDVARIVGGTTPSTSDLTNYGGDIVWVTPVDLGRLETRGIHGSGRTITEAARTKAGLELLPSGTVVMSSRAPIGHLGIADVPLCTNQGCKSFVPGPRLDSGFLYHLLRFHMPRIQAMGSGATFAEVSRAQLERFDVEIPGLREQVEIAVRLNAALDMAGDAREGAANAESRAAAVRHRVLDATLQAHTAQADRVRLGDVAELIRGVTFDGTEARVSAGEGLLPILRAGNIGDELRLDDDLVWVPARRMSTNQQMRVGDIAMCTSSGSARVVGKTALLNTTFGGSVGAFCAIVRPRPNVRPKYLAAWLRSGEFLSWRDDNARGANIQNLKLSEVSDLSLPVPNIRDQDSVLEELANKLSWVEVVARGTAAQLAASRMLSGAILRSAFEHS